MANFKLHSTYDLPGSTNFLCMLQISGFRQRQRFSTIIDDHTANSRRPAPIFFALVAIPSTMYNMLLCTRSVPVLAEIVIVGHSRWRMSCRPVRHTGHLALQPLVEGDRGRLLLSSSFFLFLFFLTKSCAQVVLLTITGSHSNSHAAHKVLLLSSPPPN